MSSVSLHRRFPILAGLLAAGLLCACSSAPTLDESTLPTLADQQVPAFQYDDLGEVTPEMAEFVERHLPRDMSQARKTWTLAYIAVDPYIMGFRYDPSVTLPPAEAFRQRTGNCMSFSLMLVAMARHAGIDARFVEIVVDRQWSTTEDTFINSKHINVLLGREYSTYLVDVSGDVFGAHVQRTKLTDREAAAEYYNNLGVEALFENDLASAWGRFRQAVSVNPKIPFLWSNLGVVYNRNGQASDAEWAYKHAMSVDRNETIAASNLYRLYESQGRWQEASGLEKTVERHRRQNPYYLARLADNALESEQYDDAIKLLKRSIRINDREYRFHGALAQALYLAGDYDDALSSLDTARALAPPAAAAELDALPLSALPE